jgi:hypothetical protein
VRVANHSSLDSQQRRAWRALARSKAVNDENFLIAKIGDSESEHRPFRTIQRLARASPARRADQTRIQETSAAQPLPANLTNAGVGGASVFRIPFSAHRIVVAQRAAHARWFLRQHFLKRDTVFFNVLVYSE